MRCWPNAGVPRLPEYGLVRAVRGWQRGAAGRAGCRRPPSRPRPRAASARRPHRHARRARLGPRRRRSEAAVRRPRPSAGRPRRPYRPPWSRRRATTMRTWPRKTASSTAFAMVCLTLEFALAHHSSAQIRQQHQRCSLHGRSAWVALHRHNGHLLRSCTCSLSRCCGLHHQAGQRRTPGLLQPGVVWRERERINQHPYAACSMHGPALRCVAVEHLPKSVAARVLRTRVLAARHHRRNHRGSLGTGCSLWLGLRRWRTLLARQGRKRLLASGRSGACSRRLGALRNGGR